jgi:hypothetical protein
MSTPLFDGSDEKVITPFDGIDEALVLAGLAAKTLTLANTNNAVNLIEFFMIFYFLMFLKCCSFYLIPQSNTNI